MSIQVRSRQLNGTVDAWALKGFLRPYFRRDVFTACFLDPMERWDKGRIPLGQGIVETQGIGSQASDHDPPTRTSGLGFPELPMVIHSGTFRNLP